MHPRRAVESGLQHPADGLEFIAGACWVPAGALSAARHLQTCAPTCSSTSRGSPKAGRALCAWLRVARRELVICAAAVRDPGAGDAQRAAWRYSAHLTRFVDAESRRRHAAGVITPRVMRFPINPAPPRHAAAPCAFAFALPGSAVPGNFWRASVCAPHQWWGWNAPPQIEE